MRCSTWRGNDLTKLNRQVQLWVCPRFEPPTPRISYTGREPVYLLSFIPSASCRSNSFTILSPSPLRGAETPQQVQATSDRSRISTKACSPITCVTGCATKSQLLSHAYMLPSVSQKQFQLLLKFSQLTRWCLRPFSRFVFVLVVCLFLLLNELRSA